ncbi:hypothetical protein [Novosphingobium profundi]|nr:hypothetical protein [Novosphingobium profundi]
MAFAAIALLLSGVTGAGVYNMARPTAIAAQHVDRGIVGTMDMV